MFIEYAKSFEPPSDSMQEMTWNRRSFPFVLNIISLSQLKLLEWVWVHVWYRVRENILTPNLIVSFLPKTFC